MPTNDREPRCCAEVLRDCGQDADDQDDNQKLDKGETTFISESWCSRLLTDETCESPDTVQNEKAPPQG